MTRGVIEGYFSRAYQPFYISVLIVCLIVAFQVYGRTQSSIGRKSQITAFRRIIWVYVFYILEDLTWIALYPNGRFEIFTTILEYVQTSILASFTFSWFVFAEIYLKGFPVQNGKLKKIYYVPLIIAYATTLFFCLNYAGLIGKSQLPSSCLYAIDSSVDFFYLLFAFFHTLARMMKEKRKTKQHRMRVILECIIYPFAGGSGKLIHLLCSVHHSRHSSFDHQSADRDAE